MFRALRDRLKGDVDEVRRLLNSLNPVRERLKATDQARKAYRKALETYRKAIEQVEEAHAGDMEAYEKALDQAEKIRDRIVDPAEVALWVARAQADDAFKKAEAQAREDLRKARS